MRDNKELRPVIQHTLLPYELSIIDNYMYYNQETSNSRYRLKLYKLDNWNTSSTSHTEIFPTYKVWSWWSVEFTPRPLIPLLLICGTKPCNIYK